MGQVRRVGQINDKACRPRNVDHAVTQIIGHDTRRIAGQCGVLNRRDDGLGNVVGTLYVLDLNRSIRAANIACLSELENYGRADTRWSVQIDREGLAFGNGSGLNQLTLRRIDTDDGNGLKIDEATADMHGLDADQKSCIDGLLNNGDHLGCHNLWGLVVGKRNWIRADCDTAH